MNKYINKVVLFKEVTNKLCFNCFESVEETADQCEACGVRFLQDNTPSSDNLEEEKIEDISNIGQINYDKELEKLEDSTFASQGNIELLIKMREKDLQRVIVIASLLGILQIYTSELLTSINTAATILSSDTTISGQFLLFSGFFYFAGIIFYYLRFSLTRKIFLVADLIHLYILYHVYTTLFAIRFRLETEDTSDLPSEIQNFLDNITLFMVSMFIFALFYVTHIFYMFRRELVNINVRR